MTLFKLWFLMATDRPLPEKIYLFTWENHYSLQKELDRRTQWFKKQNWEWSVFRYNSENRDYTNIKQTIFWWWFFATNKLIILYWTPLDTEKSNILKADQIEQLTDDLINLSIPKESLIICISYKPDKRSRFYKWIEKIDKEFSQKWSNKIKFFALPDDRELANFVKKEWEDLNLNSESIKLIIQKVWNDLFRISSELDKLRYRKLYNKKDITLNIINDVCFSIFDEDVFKLIDLMIYNREQAIKFIQEIKNKWQDWNEINGKMMRGLRNYLLILDYYEHWITDSKTIATQLKQNPWTVSNTLKNISKIKENKNFIIKLFNNIIDIDFEIKNGNSQPEMYFFTLKKTILNNK